MAFGRGSEIDEDTESETKSSSFSIKQTYRKRRVATRESVVIESS